jgi:hypothetical protein
MIPSTLRPELRSFWLPGECRPAGIVPRDSGSLGAVDVDHVAGDQRLVRLVGHAQGRHLQRDALITTYITKPMAIAMGMTIGGTNQFFITY